MGCIECGVLDVCHSKEWRLQISMEDGQFWNHDLGYGFLKRSRHDGLLGLRRGYRLKTVQPPPFFYVTFFHPPSSPTIKILENWKFHHSPRTFLSSHPTALPSHRCVILSSITTPLLVAKPLPPLIPIRYSHGRAILLSPVAIYWRTVASPLKIT